MPQLHQHAAGGEDSEPDPLESTGTHRDGVLGPRERQREQQVLAADQGSTHGRPVS